MTGAQPRNVAQQAGRRVQAFEVEVESLWVDRLTKLKPGRVVEVWLTPRLALAMRYHPMSALVGHYTRDVSLADFREDCFWALDHGRQG